MNNKSIVLILGIVAVLIVSGCTQLEWAFATDPCEKTYLECKSTCEEWKDPQRHDMCLITCKTERNICQEEQAIPENEKPSSATGDDPFVSGNMPEECVTPLVFARFQSQLQDREFLLDNVYEDDATEATVEEKSLDTVRVMVRVDDDGKDVIMAFTESGKGCYLTEGTFCGCIEGQS